MKVLLLSLLISTAATATGPTLFPELFEDFAIHCTLESDQFHKFATADDKGEVTVLEEHEWTACYINPYWGNDRACYTGDPQMVVGFINNGDGSYAFGGSDEDWYEKAYVLNDTIYALLVDGPGEYEEEVVLMGRCDF